MSLVEVIRQATSRAGVIKVNNALNPLLGSCASAPAAWLFAYLFQADPILKYGFAALGALPILCTLVAYFVLFVIDRDRLHSEAFLPRQQELSIIERKSGPPLALNSDVSTDQPDTSAACRDPDKIP